MENLVIKNGIIVTLAQPNRVLYDHALVIENGLIKQILPQKAVVDADAVVVDARNKVVMPGFVNAHMHFYSTFARGLTKAESACDFTEVLRNLWWRLDRALTLEDCYYSALVAGLEAVRHGTTTIFDHHSSPHAIGGSLGTVARAAKKLGLRACLCYEVSDRDGEKAAQEGIEENLRFIDECRDALDNVLRPLFGLHASFTLGEDTLRSCVERARKGGAGFHIHCAEDLSDQIMTQKQFGRSVVRRLADHGILGPQTICAHAVHVDDEEWDLLAETRTAVIHNPQSNMNNAVGTMDLLEASRRGVLVGLGTDAMTNNMREELRASVWAQRLLHKDPGAAFDEAVGLLIRNNQKIANRHFENVGQLKTDWAADIVCIDYVPPTDLNDDTFAGHLVYGLSQAPVDTTIVGGKILMQDKKLLCPDEEEMINHARALATAFWQRF